jgi:hypothetical protein
MNNYIFIKKLLFLNNRYFNYRRINLLIVKSRQNFLKIVKFLKLQIFLYDG